jgi:hypothetical protein
MKKLASYLFSTMLILITGCSTRLYQTPHLNVTVQDKTTETPLVGAKMHLKETVSDVVKKQEGDEHEHPVATSDDEGVIDKPAVYERRWHMYPPFLILSGGAMVDATYTVTHPDYGETEVTCGFTTLNDRCNLTVNHKIQADKKTMQLLWDDSFVRVVVTRYLLSGSVKPVNDTLVAFELDEALRESTDPKYHSFTIAKSGGLAGTMTGTVHMSECQPYKDCFPDVQDGVRYRALFSTKLDKNEDNRYDNVLIIEARIDDKDK